MTERSASMQLHTASTYRSIPGLAIASRPRSGLVAYARGLTFTVWMFSLLFGFWWVSDWFALQAMAEAGVNRKEYFYYGFAIAVVGHLTLGLGAWFTAPFRVLSDWTGRFISAFCLVMLCLAPLSIVPLQSTLYAGATMLVVVLMSLFWMSDYRVLERVLAITGFVIFSWLLVLLLRHGLTFGFGGWIGGVNRNITGTAALAGMACAMLFPDKRIRWLAIAWTIFSIVIVSSRGSIVALCAFAAVYFVLYRGATKAAIAAVLLILVVAVAFLVSPSINHVVIEKILHLHDRDRGLGSGFTGRLDMWSHAIDAFWKRPIFGWGFRSASLSGSSEIGGVHSGWIKIFVEGGIVGGLLIAGAIAAEVLRRLRAVIALRSTRPTDFQGIDIARSLHLNIVACATFIMLSTMWVYDQYYINLGSPVSLVFFLYLMAPTFVTDQGVGLRR